MNKTLVYSFDYPLSKCPIKTIYFFQNKVTVISNLGADLD